MSGLIALLESMSDLAIIVDDKGHFVACNQKVRDFFNQDEMSHFDFKAISNLLNLTYSTIDECLQASTSGDELVYPNGKITWHFHPFLEKQIQHTIILGNLFVSTPAVSSGTEDNAGTDNQSLSAARILAELPGHIYWKDLKGQYIGCNESHAKLYCLEKPDDIVGKNDFDFFNTEFAEQIRQIDETVIREKKNFCVEEALNLLHREAEDEQIFLTNKSPLTDAQGNIIGVVGVSFDITERKRIEQSLRRMQDRLRKDAETQRDYLAKLSAEVTGIEVSADIPGYVHAEVMRDFLEEIITHMPGHVYWYDRHNIYLGCNEQQAKSAGLASRRDIVGKTNSDMPWYMHAEALNKANERVMRTGKAYRVEELSEVFSPETNEKELRVFLSQKVPLYNKQGEIIGVLGVSMDITDQKRIEKELAKSKEKAEIANKAKTEFLANMSHELRTPLNAIVGMAQILQIEVNDSTYKEYVDIIYSSGKCLATLIEDILDFAKLDAGRLILSPESFDLYQLSNEVVDSLMFNANAKSLDLSLNYHDTCPREVYGDPQRIKQVLLNLTNNAIKFTMQGYVKINIEYILHPDTNEPVFRIAIIDSGIGIKDEYIDSVFDRFSQVKSSYHGQYKGAGLGLAISRQLVEMMNGQIGAYSTPEQGSEFYCYLPLPVQREKDQIQQPQDLLMPILKTKNQPNVFVVEDNELNQKVLKLMLEELGCQVVLASSAQQGLNLLAESTPDLLCLDIGLPDMSGLKVAEIVRQNEKKTNSYLPIIAITAHVLQEEKESCYAAGIDDVISKPVMRNVLKDTVEKWLNHESEENLTC